MRTFFISFNVWKPPETQGKKHFVTSAHGRWACQTNCVWDWMCMRERNTKGTERQRNSSVNEFTLSTFSVRKCIYFWDNILYSKQSGELFFIPGRPCFMGYKHTKHFCGCLCVYLRVGLVTDTQQRKRKVMCVPCQQALNLADPLYI